MSSNDVLTSEPRFSPCLAEYVVKQREMTDTVFSVLSEPLLPGQKGMVIGSGGNSEHYNSRGWITLDRNPTVGALIVGSGNNIPATEGSLDYVVAENLTIDPNYTEDTADGVFFPALLNESGKALKMGGMLIVCTMYELRGNPNPRITTVPDRNYVETTAINYGYECITISGPMEIEENGDRTQPIIYALRKIRETYQDIVGGDVDTAYRPPIPDPLRRN